ncbi:MAG: ribosome small subunit-dependent GTPase A [Pseudomonadota bacterium]
MSKRKLSRQQAFRVQRIQDERIARAGKREAAASALLDSGELGAEEEGLVTAHFGTQILVEALQGAHRGQVFRCHLRANLEALVTGDRVIWQAPTAMARAADAAAGEGGADAGPTGDAPADADAEKVEMVGRAGPDAAPAPNPAATAPDAPSGEAPSGEAAAAAPAGKPAAQPLGVITALRPRETLLVRPDPYGKLKPVAANIDRILLVVSPYPEPSALLIDRYLVACELTGIRPIILMNKADLITPANAAAIAALLAPYEAIGYETRRISASTGQLEDLSALIDQRTVVFVGQSGVGKSSIVNVLLPDADQRVGEISGNSKLGVHTTTTARLFHLPAGGILIDSPGIREFGLWHIDDDQLLAGFVEFQPFLGSCRFRNCAHRNEPGCALKVAVEAGQIDAGRFERFNKLREELKSPRA